MSETNPPYNLPIFRNYHRAVSPDGKLVAKIDPATEVSMGNPTSGFLCVSNGLHIEACNPSFVWSDDSRFLAVPKYIKRFGFRRQRLVVIDFEKKVVHASKATAWYYQPESFTAGRLVVTPNPFGLKRRLEFDIPSDLSKSFFHAWWVWWPTEGRPVQVLQPNPQ